MSLLLGIVVLCLIAGGCLIHRAWDEVSWRRDERDAERCLRLALLRERACEVAEDATVDAFGRTLEEIQTLPIQNPWSVAE